MPPSFQPKFFILYSIIFSPIFIHPCTSQCLDHQKSLLLQLRNELIFNSSRSTKLVQWNRRDQDCCKWTGVGCDGAGHVVSLQLDNEAVSGGIEDASSSLFGLKYLQKLNLAYNDFNYTRAIPRGIQSLTYLTHLNLSNAAFSGQVPSDLCFLSRLVSLDISNQQMFATGGSPLRLEHPNLETLLRNLTNLRELYLDGINITSSYEMREWSHIISSHLPNLTALSLVGCFLPGPLAGSFWQLHSLSVLRLDYNKLSTVVPDLFANFKTLNTLTLSWTSLKGSFPIHKFFRMPTLKRLDLSYNDLNGSIPPFAQTSDLSNLVYLNLKYNYFSGHIPHYLFRRPSLQELHLQGNRFNGNIEEFSILNASNIVDLDLRDNQLEGPIPDSFFQLNRNLFNGSFHLDKIQSLPNLTKLRLSNNNLSVESSTRYRRFPQLTELSLASCNLSVFPEFVKHCDMTWLDLSNNQITGDMHDIGLHLCNATDLDYLDLSGNKVSGAIPPCLLEKTKFLILGQNKISGRIPDNIPLDCNLTYIDLNNNALEGKIPNSLQNCRGMYYMDVGNNMFNDTFPCMLPSGLIFLALGSNRFHGEVSTCLNNWPFLQVIDMSSNNFSGSLESINFSSWRSMRYNDPGYYSVELSLTVKGLELKYDIISTDFVFVDMSSNSFSGEIPDAIGDLSLLHLLNLSHNALVGSIPESFGKLKEIEALDLSQNHLGGNIPTELGRLEFLQVLNLTYNELVGEIPKGRQMQTFSADSFVGNPGLCGFINVNVSCTRPDLSPPPGNEKAEEEEEKEIEWAYVCAAAGYVVGLGSFVWLLVFCRSFRHKYFGKIDDVVAEMFDAIDRRRRRRRSRRARAARDVRNGGRRQ